MIHSASNLVPNDYQHVLAFAYPGSNPYERHNVDQLVELRRTQPFYRKPSGKGGCDVCGAHFRMGSVFRHVSGEHIVVGWECAEKIDWHVGHYKGEVLRSLEQLRKRSQRRDALRQFVKDSQGDTILVDLRLGREVIKARRKGQGGDLPSGQHIVADIRAKLIQYGSISEAQANLVRKLARQAREKAEQPEEARVPAPEGKVVVSGEVVGLKDHYSDFGVVCKMTVKVQAEGGVWLVWVTVPSGLSVARGDSVEFSATLTRSDRDPSFAFGKRPTKARRLEVA